MKQFGVLVQGEPTFTDEVLNEHFTPEIIVGPFLSEESAHEWMHAQKTSKDMQVLPMITARMLLTDGSK